MPDVIMLDPNSHTLPYDRALVRALTGAGCQVELAVSPFLYEPAATAGSGRLRRRFFRVSAGAAGRRLRLHEHDHARRVLKAAEYPFDLLGLLMAMAWQPPAIIHVQWSLQPALDRQIWRLWQALGARIVLTAHNLRPHEATSLDQAPNAPLYRAADAVIVHSSTSAAALVSYFGVVERRVVVAPHGPLLEDEPEWPPAEARRRLGIPVTDQVVLFAGLIEPYKGLTDLVTAFRGLAPRHPGARLVIAGRPNSPVQPLLDQLADAGLGGRVTADLRYLPQRDLAAYLSAADVVVLPYRATTTSGLLMAARRFGRAVVATAVGDLAATIDHDVDGLLVPPADPPALARAVAGLLTDVAARRRLGLAGQRRALERDTWERAAVQTLTAYRLAITSPARRD